MSHATTLMQFLGVFESGLQRGGDQIRQLNQALTLGHRDLQK